MTAPLFGWLSDRFSTRGIIVVSLLIQVRTAVLLSGTPHFLVSQLVFQHERRGRHSLSSIGNAQSEKGGVMLVHRHLQQVLAAKDSAD